MSRRACTNTRGVDTTSCAVHSLHACWTLLQRCLAGRNDPPRVRKHARRGYGIMCCAFIDSRIVCMICMLDNCAAMPTLKLSSRACTNTHGVDTHHVLCIDSRNARMIRMSDNVVAMHSWKNVPPCVRKRARGGYGIMCCACIDSFIDSRIVRTICTLDNFAAMHSWPKCPAARAPARAAWVWRHVH